MNSFISSQLNLQILVTEIYKVINNLSSILMKDIFRVKNIKYDLRSRVNFTSHNVRSVHCGTETISLPGSTNLGPST